MKVEGSCHCGQITFEAEIDPGAVRICHCTDCQTLTGSAYRVNVQTPAASFVLRSGTPKTYIPPKAATNAPTPSAPTAARQYTRPIRMDHGHTASVSVP
jgi:hypothetical protein